MPRGAQDKAVRSTKFARDHAHCLGASKLDASLWQVSLSPEANRIVRMIQVEHTTHSRKAIPQLGTLADHQLRCSFAAQPITLVWIDFPECQENAQWRS